MAQDNRMGFGDKLKQKLHLGPTTQTSSHKTSNQSSSSESTIMNSFVSNPAQYEGNNAPALGVQYEGPKDYGEQKGEMNRDTPLMAEGQHPLGQRGMGVGEGPTIPGTSPGHHAHATDGAHTILPSTPEPAFPRPQQQVSPELSSQLAKSQNAPGGPAGSAGPSGDMDAQKDLAALKPNTTDVGIGGQTAEKDGPMTEHGIHQSRTPPMGAMADDDQVGNQANLRAPGTANASQRPSDQAQGITQSTASVAQPYVDKIKQTSQPLVDKVKAAGAAVAERAQPAVQQVRESSQPLLNSAAVTAQRVGEASKQTAAQAYEAAAQELDRHGVNKETTQQKMADIGQAMKDYSVVGQERAGEYLQQAVDQACAIGSDGHNQNIFLKIFGTIALIWLAFGFSLTALVALGIAAVIAALLSRYTRRDVGPHTRQQTHVPDFASTSGKGGAMHSAGPPAHSARVPANTPRQANPVTQVHYHEA